MGFGGHTTGGVPDPLTIGGMLTAGGVAVTGTVVPTNGMYLPAANRLGFSANSALVGGFDGTTFVVGEATTYYTGGLGIAEFHKAGASTSQYVSIIGWTADATRGANLNLIHVKSNTLQTHGAVVNADFLAAVNFMGDDGTTVGLSAANIESFVDNTVGANQIPGRLVFSTSGSTGTKTERLRIDSAGLVTLTGSLTITRATDPSIVMTRTTAVAANQIGGFNGQISGGLGELGAIRIIAQNVGAGTEAADLQIITSTAGSRAQAATFLASGVLLMNTGAAANYVGTTRGQIESNAAGAATSNYLAVNVYTTDTARGANLVLNHSKSNTLGAQGAVASGDYIGSVQWGASDGTTMGIVAATIEVNADNTVAAAQVPGRLVFKTANSAGANTERLRIDSAGLFTFVDGINFAVGSTNGMQIATAITQKLGFYGVAAIAQRAGAAQAAVGITGSTQTTPFGYTTAAQADAIVTLVNELRAWAVVQGFIKGAA